MLTHAELKKEVLIHVAGQYFSFNDHHDSTKKFVELFDSIEKMKNPCFPEQIPDDIGTTWEPFDDYLKVELYRAVKHDTESLIEFIKTGLILNKFECLLIDKTTDC